MVQTKFGDPLIGQKKFGGPPKFLYTNIQIRLKNGPASGTMYVKFEDEKAGNKYKDAHLCGELKQCVAITVKTNSYPLAKK